MSLCKKKTGWRSSNNFRINLPYGTRFLTSVDIVDDTLEVSKVTKTTIPAGATTILIVQYDEAVETDDLMLLSDVVLLRV